MKALERALNIVLATEYMRSKQFSNPSEVTQWIGEETIRDDK